MKKVIIYTDGACSGNPGVGGYGAILNYLGHEKEISGLSLETTNNRMELTACIEALKLLKEQCEVDLYTDSAYVCNAFLENWITKWILNNFFEGTSKEIKNIPLWKELLSLTNYHKVNWYKVKGHSDNIYNNRCDKLATGEIKKYKDSITA